MPARTRRLGRTSASHSLPSFRVPDRFDEQHLDLASSGLADVQSRGTHAAVVDHEQVAGLQQVGKVRDHMVPGRRTGPSIDQQASGIARLDRLLRDRRVR